MNTAENMKAAAEILGVEVGEPFALMYGMKGVRYRFHGGDLQVHGPHDKDEDGAPRWKSASGILGYLLTGKEIVQKVQYIPKDGRQYYYIRPCGDVVSGIYNRGAFCLALLYMGNCFRTFKEAARNKETILKKMREAESDEN